MSTPNRMLLVSTSVLCRYVKSSSLCFSPTTSPSSAKQRSVPMSFDANLAHPIATCSLCKRLLLTLHLVPIVRGHTLHRDIDLLTRQSSILASLPTGQFSRAYLNFKLMIMSHFLIDDVEESWEYAHKFDLVHSRMMQGAFKISPSSSNKLSSMNIPSENFVFQQLKHCIY